MECGQNPKQLPVTSGFFFLNTDGMSTQDIKQVELLLKVNLRPTAQTQQNDDTESQPNQENASDDHMAARGLNVAAREFVPGQATWPVNGLPGDGQTNSKPSYADLFKGSGTGHQGDKPETKAPVATPAVAVAAAAAPAADIKDQIKRFLQSHGLHLVATTNPRGMKNNGNECFMSSAIQVLLVVPEFLGLFKKMAEKFQPEALKGPMPFSEATLSLVRQYESQNKNGCKGVLEALEKNPFSQLLTLMDSSAIQEGQQGDACEFMTSLLTKLESELSVPENQSGNNKSIEERAAGQEDDEAGWQQVNGRRNARRQRQAYNPIRHLFGGAITEVTETMGTNDQVSKKIPFNEMVLPYVDKEDFALEEAINAHFMASYRENSVESASAKIVKIAMDEMPPVLYINCANTTRDASGEFKGTKQMTFGPELKLRKEWLTENARKRVEEDKVHYALCGSIFHRGLSHRQGHYVAFTYNLNLKRWCMADDETIKLSSEQELLNYCTKSNVTVPHCLLYRRIQGSNVHKQ